MVVQFSVVEGISTPQNIPMTTLNLDFDTMYGALCARDPDYEGLFITGVKSTGIFCRTTCTARKPLAANVEFFPDTAAAMRKGYRACKVCKPLAPLNATPEPIRQLIADLTADPALRLKARDLRDRGLEPATVTRWFRKHHGMTFVAYQRLQRINRAFKKLDSGAKVTDTALDLGYDSLSGFNDSFKAVFGTPPTRKGTTIVIDLKRLETPLGTMIACATANGMNKIAVIIPCHRVIGSDGKLTGYAGGLHRKQWLLAHEMRNSNKE